MECKPSIAIQRGACFVGEQGVQKTPDKDTVTFRRADHRTAESPAAVVYSLCLSLACANRTTYLEPNQGIVCLRVDIHLRWKAAMARQNLWWNRRQHENGGGRVS